MHLPPDRFSMGVGGGGKPCIWPWIVLAWASVEEETMHLPPDRFCMVVGGGGKPDICPWIFLKQIKTKKRKGRHSPNVYAKILII
jgi:hypothetical protein